MRYGSTREFVKETLKTFWAEVNARINGIESANNGTLTIKQKNVVKGTFSANQSGDVEINLSDDNTTYTAGDGIGISNNKISNSGIRDMSAGNVSNVTGNGYAALAYDKNGTKGTFALPVKGLKSAAYKDASSFAGASHTHFIDTALSFEYRQFATEPNYVEVPPREIKTFTISGQNSYPDWALIGVVGFGVWGSTNGRGSDKCRVVGAYCDLDSSTKKPNGTVYIKVYNEDYDVRARIYPYVYLAWLTRKIDT